MSAVPPCPDWCHADHDFDLQLGGLRVHSDAWAQLVCGEPVFVGFQQVWDWDGDWQPPTARMIDKDDERLTLHSAEDARVLAKLVMTTSRGRATRLRDHLEHLAERFEQIATEAGAVH